MALRNAAFIALALEGFLSCSCAIVIPVHATSVKISSKADAVVALTREAGKNGKLASLLGSRGVRTVEVPCIAHEEGADLPRLAPTLAENTFSYVAVTSPEAASVFLKGWREAGKPDVTVACVGKATGEALQRGGISPVFAPSKANAESLAAELPLPPSSTTTAPIVLYPASSKAQRTLEQGLAGRGFDVLRLNTYGTTAAAWSPEDAKAAAAAAVAAFGSPSAVKTWAARLGSESCVAACIGETSAAACTQQGWRDDRIFFAEQPGVEGWAEAVDRAIESILALASDQN